MKTAGWKWTAGSTAINKVAIVYEELGIFP